MKPLLDACASFMRTGSFRPYADGQHVTHRRRQKSQILHDLVAEVTFAEPNQGHLADFGCADGAIPVALLESDLGPTIHECVGVTLDDYNELGCETGFSHPRFRRVQADLQQPLSDVLPDEYRGRFDVVTATAFLHYLDNPEAALDNARWLLRDEGVLIISVPARWVLKCRLNPVVMLGKPVGATRQVRTRSSWLQLFEQSGWTMQRTFNCQFTGLPGPFVMIDKAVHAASGGAFDANLFFCMTPGRSRTPSAV